MKGITLYFFAFWGGIFCSIFLIKCCILSLLLFFNFSLILFKNVFWIEMKSWYAAAICIPCPYSPLSIKNEDKGSIFSSNFFIVILSIKGWQPYWRDFLYILCSLNASLNFLNDSFGNSSFFTSEDILIVFAVSLSIW